MSRCVFCYLTQKQTNSMSRYLEGDLTARTSLIGGDMTGNSTGLRDQQRDDDGLIASTSRATETSEDDWKKVNSDEKNNRKPSMALMKLKTYLHALRPWSLSASLVPTLLGSAISYRTSGIHDFNLLTFVFTIFTIISVHCAGNVVNTYFDYVKGIDNRKSDDRTLVDHILSKDEVSNY